MNDLHAGIENLLKEDFQGGRDEYLHAVAQDIVDYIKREGYVKLSDVEIDMGAVRLAIKDNIERLQSGDLITSAEIALDIKDAKDKVLKVKEEK